MISERINGIKNCRFQSNQIKAIQDFKVSKKSRCGIIAFVHNFEVTANIVLWRLAEQAEMPVYCKPMVNSVDSFHNMNTWFLCNTNTWFLRNINTWLFHNTRTWFLHNMRTWFLRNMRTWFGEASTTWSQLFLFHNATDNR